ncbi:hypothetical protein [Phaeovulum sp.]|uniref:hypothetical protein n=1 Tax=Phaeovulum sp. TaxID=2934796 RepID=UPI00273211CD|nr:hypothetical protein [Phaeovulum sp.]MDP1670166.1 hypothetical protein [Phaeovulum sp.]MDZ4120338.1 hypothetical protein [Phaeovulum sp.]
MKRITTLTAILALTASAALAQEPFVAGAEFMLNWDMDGDGQVTLAEATERRESIFYMFDLDGNSMYSDDELIGIDEHKALEAELGRGVGQGRNGQARASMQTSAQLPGQLPARGGRQGGGRGYTQTMQQPGIAGQQPGVMGRGGYARQPGVAGQVPGVMPNQPGTFDPTLRHQPGTQGIATAGGARSANLTDLATIGTAQEILMFDADFNGIITMEEFLNGTPAWFAMRDRNVDGVITTADFGNGRF